MQGSPEVADVIADLDARIRTAPIERPTLREREIAWRRLATESEDDELPSLLSTAWPPTPDLAESRIAALVARAPSRRISHALIGIITRGQYPSRWGEKLSRMIARSLLAQADPAITRYFAAAE